MTFQEFLTWMRQSGQRYIVLDHTGEPEFVIEPFSKKRPESSIEIINKTIADVAEKEHEELSGWDAMVEKVERATPHTQSEEPQFQFETIDE